MEFTSIESFPTPHRPKWKTNAPHSRLLYASDGEHCVLLSAMGPMTVEDFDFVCWLDAGKNQPGIWVIEVFFVHSSGWTYYGYDYDIEVESGELRPATIEEITRFNQGEDPWDWSIWEEIEEEA